MPDRRGHPLLYLLGVDRELADAVTSDIGDISVGVMRTPAQAPSVRLSRCAGPAPPRSSTRRVLRPLPIPRKRRFALTKSLRPRRAWPAILPLTAAPRPCENGRASELAAQETRIP